jgi:Flp pilus assembly protein TadD
MNAILDTTVVDQKRASELAREGFDLWQAGQLEESVPKYHEALRLADPDHYALADYHGEFAAVLATLGRDAEALQQYRQALQISIQQNPEEAGLDVAVARYFLSEHLLKMNEPEEALIAIEPVLRSQVQWLAHVVKADALLRVGRREEARTAAGLAVELAASDEKRANIRKRLAHILKLESG